MKKEHYTKKELEQISEKWHTDHSYLGDAVFGMEDGLVENLGVTIGVAAAAVGLKIVVIAGTATLFSGGVSMAAGAYLSTRARNQLYQRELAHEKREVEETPEIEREEVRKIYYKKGFRGADLDRAVEIITEDKQRWIKVMMEEELGMHEEKQNNPFKAGGTAGLFYMSGAIIPILPYFFLDNSRAILTSLSLTALALFTFGFWKGKYTKLNPWKSGFEMLIVGLLAFAIGSIVGRLLGYSG